MERLNVGQQHAVDKIKEFMDNDERVISLLGSPGTGKTFVINHLAEHYDINISATTNQAAALINGKTIHNLTGFRIKSFQEWDGSLNNAAPILIDEASMLPMHVMDHLINERSNKLILVGDPDQLVVGNCVKINQFEHVTLTENMRAKSLALEKLVEHLAQSVRTQTMPDFKLHRGEHLTIIEDFGTYVAEIHKEQGSKLVMAYRNAIVEKYEELVDEGITVHKAQGQSVDIVFIDMSDIYSAYAQQKTQWNNPISKNEMLRMILVGMSRARHKIIVFYGKSRANSCVQGAC